ncbi:hypothetical protein [Thalassotalea fusca]
MTDAQLDRIKFLTDMFIVGTISEDERVELEELQKEWLLYTDKDFSENYHVRRSYQK